MVLGGGGGAVFPVGGQNIAGVDKGGGKVTMKH